MKLLTDQLYQNKWNQPFPHIISYLASMNHRFQQRFEAELDNEKFRTQNF
jgi:hypothetical protein